MRSNQRTSDVGWNCSVTSLNPVSPAESDMDDGFFPVISAAASKHAKNLRTQRRELAAANLPMDGTWCNQIELRSMADTRSAATGIEHHGLP